MEDNPQPTEIIIDGDQGQMRITWKDDHSSSYPLVFLRAHCPCASCLAEGLESPSDPSGVIPLIPSTRMEKPDEITGAEHVGRYALRLSWGDGHDTGIYTYTYLRNLCQCPECSGA